MNKKRELMEIEKYILYENKEVSFKLNKDKTISFLNNDYYFVSKEDLNSFFKKLSSINNNTVKLPLNWSESWVRILLNIFAALSTFTLTNYLLYFKTGAMLNHFHFLYDLTWVIVVLIPFAIVVTHVFSTKSVNQAKFNLLQLALPKVDMVYFITAFYNHLNSIKFFSNSEQSIRNANVITKDIFEPDGLKMLEGDLIKWFRSIGLTIKK